jgi:ketol-acid reductoisomerase
VVLIAPKGPGDLVRRQYQQGRGVPSLIAVTRTRPATPFAKASPTATASAARAAVCSRPRSRKETETDLFGEQAVLCGGTSDLVLKGFETLVEAGYQPKSPITSACTS